MINYKQVLAKKINESTDIDIKDVARVIEYLRDKEFIDEVRLRDAVVLDKYDSYEKSEGIKQKTILSQLCTDFELSDSVVHNIIYHKFRIF